MLYVDTSIYMKKMYSLFMTRPRMAPLGPLEGVKRWGEGPRVGKTHFHHLLRNQWLNLNQTLWGSSLRGRDPKLLIRGMWPLGGLGGGGKGNNGQNFKISISPEPGSGY